MLIPILVLLAVFVLIAVRQVGNIRLQIWQIMLGGAIAVLVTGQISPHDAILSVNIDVILFLFGMFVIGRALEESGYLFHLSYKFFRHAKSSNALILMVLFGIGAASAVLTNDTLAIVGTPLVLLLAKQHKLPPKMMLMALAFAITIGSVMSPIGNPQNLLIALGGGMQNPFLTFFRYLLVPTLINLLIAFLVLRIFYKNDFISTPLFHFREPIKDPELARLSMMSLRLVVALIGLKILLVFVQFPVDFRLTYIALIGALPVLVFSKRRAEMAKSIDWYTLVFFASMFVLMQSVWQAGFFQSLINNGLPYASTPAILGISVMVSQLISNVPLVALYIPLLQHAGASVVQLMALAAGSTIAGNLLILGAASNVIIIQNAEKKGETITFKEFAKIGVPLTLLNIAVYWVFLSI